MDQNGNSPRINLRRAAFTCVGLGSLLFLAAGTMRWAGGRGFLAEITIGGLITEAWLARHDPGLLAERRTARGQAGWDRVITSIMPLLWLTWLPLMALDAMRYQTSFIPFWLQCAGAVMIAASFY
ncbi:isoprenylcysteine carboxylmethyltransferase family protein, partial [Streptococcus pyogenes]